MHSMMRKTTFREIRKSLGRYFAILAIVALGVGFFAGLKTTRSVMLKSADEYLTEKQLYDFRLLSTLGFEQEDVEALAAKEEVRAVEGAFFTDILYQLEQGNEGVMKAHSLTENINGLELIAGRMPRQADECVVDSNLYGEAAVGSRIILTESNTEEDLKKFAYREYTITGIVQSSYYIQFERGNTSLGNGVVSGFMYLPIEGFRTEYFTEIFVKFDEDYNIYSEEYQDFIEEKQALWEKYCEEQGERRYRSILTDAEAELADAEGELAEKKAEAEAELADAKQELEAAGQKLAEAEAELAEGEEKLADAGKEIADGEKTLAEKERELRDARAEIEENEALLAEKKQEYESGMDDYHAGEREIEQARQDLESAKGQLEAGEAELQAAKAELEGKKEAVQQAVSAGYISDAEAQTQLSGIEAGLYAIALKQEELAQQKAQVESGLEQVYSADAQLGAAYMQLVEGGRQIEDAERQLSDARKQLEDGEQQLLDAEEELKEARRTLAEKKQELLDGRQELENGYQEYEEGLKEYEDACREYEEEVAEAEEKLAEAREELEEFESPDTYVLGRNTNVGYVCFENDSNIVEGIANVFPIFFFLVAALVCITTMNRMVEEQRTQIGVLKALGYGEGTIMGKYLFYSGSAAMIGGVGGYLLGTHLFPLVIWMTYKIMYKMGDVHYIFEWKLAALSLLAALVCSMGATWFSVRYELMEAAAGLMRPKAPKAGKRVFLEKVPFIWKRLTFLQKVSVRNIVRYKKRFFMMVIGISGCTALLVTGFGIRDSVTNIANQQYGEIQLYDLSIVLKDGVRKEAFLNESWDGADEELASLLGLVEEEYQGKYHFVMETTMELMAGDRTKSVNIIVSPEPDRLVEFWELHTGNGEPVAYPKAGEAVITDKLSENYKISVGDSITLYDDDRNGITVTVSGICENYIYNYVYLHPDTYEAAMGEIAYQNIFVKLPEGADSHEAGASAMQMDNVTSVTITEDMLMRFSNMMDSMNYIVLVVIFCAAALAFIVLYNLNNINITERIREIATIKVLGFFKKETASYVFRENMVLTAIGCAVGLLLGKLLHLYVMHEINIDLVSFDVQVKWGSYLISIFLTFVFNWIVNRMMSGKLEKINMAESLKSVD